MKFNNSLIHISNPIPEFREFRYVSWDKDIYPQFKGDEDEDEIRFVFELARSHGLHRFVDFAVGKGLELAGIARMARSGGYRISYAEANEVSDAHIAQASGLFSRLELDIALHKADWLDLERALPPYTRTFDFGLLTGNSLALLGGGSREYTNRAHKKVVENIANLIDRDGYLLIDHRNYDFICSLMNLSIDEIADKFRFDYSVYYHASNDRIRVHPAYISDTLIVLHYYDLEEKTWSKLDYFPIFQREMSALLGTHFHIEDVFRDFGKGTKEKSLFTQYLVRRI